MIRLLHRASHWEGDKLATVWWWEGSSITHASKHDAYQFRFNTVKK